MCLGIPGQLEKINPSESTDALIRTGKVRFGGITKEVNLAYTPEVAVGDYVIVHVGFAISVIDESEATRILETLSQLGDP